MNKVEACLLIVSAVSLAAVTASADELPPLTQPLLNTAGAVCIKVSKDGLVEGAYLLISTGKPDADRDMVTWAKQLYWAKAAPGEKMRETWFPMPISFGNAKAPDAPPSCPAPQAGK